MKCESHNKKRIDLKVAFLSEGDSLVSWFPNKVKIIFVVISLQIFL